MTKKEQLAELQKQIVEVDAKLSEATARAVTNGVYDITEPWGPDRYRKALEIVQVNLQRHGMTDAIMEYIAHVLGGD